jgi:hypothetical protein
MHNLNNIIKQWNDFFTMDMNLNISKCEIKNFQLITKKQSMIFKTLNIISQKHKNNYIE